MDGPDRPAATVASTDAGRLRAAPPVDSDDTTCPRCGESRDLAKVKGCLKCLACGFKFDCNGW